MKTWVMIVAAVLAMSCTVGTRKTFVQPSPSEAQVQGVRQIAMKALAVADTVLTFADESGKTIAALPDQAMSRAQKNTYDCALVKTFGTSVQASAGVVATCGSVPLRSEAPFTKAIARVQAATTCPGLQSSASQLLIVFDPMLRSLELSGSPVAALAATSFQVAMGYFRVISTGGVACR